MLLPQNPGPSTTESELSHRNPSRSTSGIGCSYLCNRVVPPLRVLLPLYPFYLTSEGAPATEFGHFYHRIRTVTQEPELFHSGVGLSHLWNRATPPLRVLLPLYPFYSTSEGAPATESESFYHRIRTATQDSESFHIRSRVLLPMQSSGSTSEGHSTTESELPHQEPESFHIRNPICPTSEPGLSHHIKNRSIPPLNPARNLKSQGEFTASRQI